LFSDIHDGGLVVADCSSPIRTDLLQYTIDVVVWHWFLYEDWRKIINLPERSVRVQLQDRASRLCTLLTELFSAGDLQQHGWTSMDIIVNAPALAIIQSNACFQFLVCQHCCL